MITGTGTITQSGATTTILQASQTLSLNWKSYNIAPQETVDFVQPSVTSIAVNRIFDVNGTQILGHLDANGLVYLINPNGIVFGRGAQVDVGGLVASTLDLNDPTLGGDTKTFSGSGSGSIVNDGTLTAGSGGYVALLANKVSNQGTISAQLGSVAVGAGSAATLTFAGSRLVHMQVDQGVLNALAENSGVIRADGGQVLMTAGAQDALLASVVNNTGLIEANTVENHGGSIALMGGQAGQVVVKGTLDASSATGQGGEIVASGETVSVGDDARVTATGATGGGGISIGGGWQGGGGIAQATSVYVSNTATLDASATGHGNGGEVVVRSDVNDPASATRVYGTLLARGGPGGGDGGRIETSGHWLDVTGIAADASAASGAAGEWLLDPYNVIIGSPVTGTGYTPPNFTPSANSTILASAINTALTAGTSVTINTGTYGSGSSLGDITVNTAISKTGGGTATLTLQAADSIIINQPITSTSGALNVNLWADNDGGVHNGVGVVLLYNSITTNGGAIAFGTNSTMAINGVTTLVGGDVYVGGTSAVALSTSGGAINLYGQLIIANTGGFNLNSANGSVMFAGLVDSGDTYAFVSNSGITWTNALTAAKSGLGANVGDTYLATITSRLENAVAGAVAGYASSWLGASRVTGIGTDAVWRWVTGPEGLTNNGQGLPFFTQNGSATTNGNGGTAIGVSYTNWNNGEPNNSGGTNLTQSGRGEWVMQFTGSQGQWNDLSPTNSSGILGYVQETNLAPSALYVNAGTGLVTFAAAIGSNKSLSTLNVTGGTIALPSPLTVNTTGAQTFTGQVTVGGNPVNVLTVSAPNLSTTYGLGVPTLGTPTYSGFVNGNTIASLTTASTESTTATAQPNAGSYPISLSVAVDPNYYILYNPGTLIVNLATLSITASSSTKTYRAANPALTVAYSGLQYSDTTTSILTTLPTATTAATTASNAGTYATTAAGAVLSSSNYTIAYVPGALTVTPAPLTVTGLSGTARPYNGLTSDTLTGTGVLSGLQNGETLTLSNATNGTLASANAGSEGVSTALALVAGTGSISNYSLTQPTLPNVLIGQAPLTVTGLTGTGRTYNGLTSDALTGTGVLAGLQNSETLTLANTTTGTLASANAGSEPVTTALTLVAGTGSISNYTLTQPTLANVLIGQAPLTVTGLTGTGRTYNGLT
ncbi:MAG: MBG domain-containing protein, partial [Steroidobacteraceae bacterium]